MARAPCCDHQLGFKKGPWTPEEDRILVAFIQQHGHGNWRALPKQAGLLRCGKSCRLRWMNYLRPDIKRGNFSREEEDAIIDLHEKLGNRWSTIAARLPGRTDNEIKNVWHTHLKKRLPKKVHPNCDSNFEWSEPPNNFNFPGKISPQPSSSEFSSVADSSSMRNIKNEHTEDSLQPFPEIDESFWSDSVSSDYSSRQSGFRAFAADKSQHDQFPFSPANTPEVADGYTSRIDDSMEFWYEVFVRAGGLVTNLPEPA